MYRAIRSQAPKLVMIEHGEGSETVWLLVTNDDLINLMWLKRQSNPIREDVMIYHKDNDPLRKCFGESGISWR